MAVVLNTVTEPASEPISLDQAKKHLRVDITDDDDYITGLISAARRPIETHVKKTFIATTFDAIYDSFPFGGGYYSRGLRQFYGAFPGGMGATFPGFLPTNTGIIELPRAPLMSVTSITYYDSSGAQVVLDPANYIVQPGTPGLLQPQYGMIWPTTQARIGAVTVRFVAGYGMDATTVPENVKSAIKMFVGELYENRESRFVGTGSTLVDLTPTIVRLLSSDDASVYG